jgi:thiamine-phosphate pyrophosphorylase
MLVVISSPVTVPQEAEWFNRFFEAGLEVLHLRKPAVDEETLRALLRDIDSQYYSRLAWHQHHVEGEAWNIQRIHLTATVRQRTSPTQVERWRACGKTISTSIHSPEEYGALASSIAYTFIGPVFPSISKPGYKPIASLQAPVRGLHSPKVIAIGGIESHRCQEACESGFDGVAVLGAVWQRGNPVENFKRVQEAWYIHGRL